MRYRVKGLEIRSENAAKPISQSSGYLRKWLMNVKPVGAALDYGCGKLRYGESLASRCSSLTFVDSAIQLDRLQVIDGVKTSVRDYVESHWTHARVLDPASFASDRRTYSFVLCANVLSAIPDPRVRAAILRQILVSLKKKGRALFTSQYRNSYFKQLANAPNSKPHLDGWIVESAHGPAYYGILPRPKIETLLRRNGFAIRESWINDQSAYVLACTDHEPLATSCRTEANPAILLREPAQAGTRRQ
jgi:hypothetical protein